MGYQVRKVRENLSKDAIIKQIASMDASIKVDRTFLGNAYETTRGAYDDYFQLAHADLNKKLEFRDQLRKLLKEKENEDLYQGFGRQCG